MSYLVIQGIEVETPDLKEIAKLSGSTRIEGIGNNAFRLHEYKTQQGVPEYCAKAELDFAFVPVPRKLSDFGLVAMDMDSTLITIECIDEIADIQGIKPQVAAITASAMRGEIEYHESLRRRRQRSSDDGGGQRFYCVSRQAGGEGKRDVLFRLCRIGWVVESLRLEAIPGSEGSC